MPFHSAGIIVPDPNPNTQAPVSRVTPEGPSFLATGNNGPWEKHTQFGNGRPFFSAPLGRMRGRHFGRQRPEGRSRQEGIGPPLPSSHPHPEPQEVAQVSWSSPTWGFSSCL